MFVKEGARQYDWAVIAAFYANGHTASECQREFEISNGAWYAAVQRGAVVLRGGPRPRTRTGTREAVARLHADGTSRADIARRLGISPTHRLLSPSAAGSAGPGRGGAAV